jgi:hypothetical protein
MKRTNIYLTERQLAALRAKAGESGLSVAEHVRRAVDEYLARKKK